jgi:hypothetical protein
MEPVEYFPPARRGFRILLQALLDRLAELLVAGFRAYFAPMRFGEPDQVFLEFLTDAFGFRVRINVAQGFVFWHFD